MLFYFLLLPVALARAPGGPWDVFNYAPKSKTVYARDVYKCRFRIRCYKSGREYWRRDFISKFMDYAGLRNRGAETSLFYKDPRLKNPF